MYAVLSHLMAATLAAHALLGCCWQRAEDCARCDRSAAVDSHVAPCCAHDHGASKHQHHPNAPCKCRVTCAGVCTYLPTQKTQLDQPSLTGLHDLAALIPSSVGLPTSSQFARGQTRDGARVETPLGLHLLHQVLLI